MEGFLLCVRESKDKGRVGVKSLGVVVAESIAGTAMRKKGQGTPCQRKVKARDGVR